MTRFPNWQSRLDVFLVENAARKFRYGSFDCCLFVCDAIEAMTGIDPAASFRGLYSSRKEAMAILKERYGNPSVWDVARGVTGEMKLEECLPTLARRGDLVLIPRKTDYSLGIVDLTGRIAVLHRSEGIVRMSIEAAQIAWHV